MRRAKIGDVYCIRLPNGYKLYQWAYRIPRKGDFIRVFDGLYDSIPQNIESIVSAPHSYIIAFYASRAYRIGLASFLDNYNVPNEYPFPKYQIRFRIDREKQKVYRIHVMNSDDNWDVWQWYDVSSIKELPQEYQNITLINGVLTPNWLLYLFDNGFDLQHMEKFDPGSNPEMTLQPYTDIVNTYYKTKKNTGDILKEQKAE